MPMEGNEAFGDNAGWLMIGVDTIVGLKPAITEIVHIPPIVENLLFKM